MHLVDKRTVAKELGFHPEHVMRLAREGRFPKPIKMTDAQNGAVRFIREEIDAWLAKRAAARHYR